MEARRRRLSLLAFLPDLELAFKRQWITEPIYAELRRLVEARCVFLKVAENWWNVSWPRRVASLRHVARRGKVSELRWCGTRLLPLPLFLTLGAAWSRTRLIGQQMAMAPRGQSLNGRETTG